MAQTKRFFEHVPTSPANEGGDIFIKTHKYLLKITLQLKVHENCGGGDMKEHPGSFEKFYLK